MFDVHTPSQQLNQNRDQPLRAELFSAVQMERHGSFLASTHKLDVKIGPDKLLARLASNKEVLSSFSRLLTIAVRDERAISPAGEWLLDNFYLIEEQIRTVTRHFSKGYTKRLPRLLHGPSAGLPRVYDIALETISHGDGRVEMESLNRFIAAYQRVSPLTLGELWAIPIMLRLACIENLRRVVSDLAQQRAYRELADSWADTMIDTAEKDPNRLILVVSNMATSNPPMVSSFVAELSRRLQGQGSALVLPLTWIEQQLATSGLTTEYLVDAETKLQTVDVASISNTIGSLRSINATDWQKFVETNSVVESTLCEDPSGVYSKMEFQSRDQYRHVVERIARQSVLSEGQVAGKAIDLACQAKQAHGSEPSQHVGFYLIDSGLPDLERAVNMRYRWIKVLQRLLGRATFIFYLGGIAAITVALTTILLSRLTAGELLPWQWLLIISVFVLCSEQVAVAFVNWLTMLLTNPQALPRMDFTEAIPQEYKTLVVIPTLLVSTDSINSLADALEVRFLANQMTNLYFALLTDFKDAQEQSLPEDNFLLQLAQERIEQLNEKYKTVGKANFFLFHRPRKWNEQENVYMGYERKRGKLSALNAYLRGVDDNSFSSIIGDTTSLSNVKYVITLDTDTQLPRDIGRQLIGVMAHPLNQPVWDARRERVTAGYGILQPRVSASLLSTYKSSYAHLHGGEPGIDPYTNAISDVYQDLFSQGSFIGKGIYDIDAFERSLKDRFPENRILSHDLLEGCYARSGLISDLELYDEYPSLYSSDVNRRFRWIRGDWQIFDWLLPVVPGSQGKEYANHLSLLSRWKILDNLRRSLTPVAFTLLAILGWTTFPHIEFWTLSLITMILLPSLMASGEQIFRKKKEVLFKDHLLVVLRSAGRQLAQAAFTLTCLPYEALLSLNAIGQTLYRMLITHKHLLEWNSSEVADTGLSNSLFGFCQRMCGSFAIAIGTTIYLLAFRPQALPFAIPILLAWFIAPVAAWWLSRPSLAPQINLKASDALFLRKIARRSWAFFQVFAAAEDNWLVADNYQEKPIERTAHRTSPTDIGLALLANLTAYNFGYITSGRLLERTTNTFNTMDLLERHRGHFYNWYDTESLKPLLPIYISTVDSGNLAGYLLTLSCGLTAMSDEKILNPNLFDGLNDTLAVLSESVTKTEQTNYIVPTGLPYIRSSIARLQKCLDLFDKSITGLTQIRALLAELSNYAGHIHDAIDATNFSEAAFWADCLFDQCTNALSELDFLTPWISLMPESPQADLLARLDTLPTMRELAGLENEAAGNIHKRLSTSLPEAEVIWLSDLQAALAKASNRANERIAVLNELSLRASELAQMDYTFLFDKDRKLLSIGYNVTNSRLDTSYYDLLASEARLAHFIAIAQGQLPQESWFALGRLLTISNGNSVLFSWGGSMFEYLMPLILMPAYEHTLLNQTYRAVVERQIEYGNQRGVPWGISESGYRMVDAHLNYQYRSFGVPGLGLQRGLADDLVIAPYATALALMVAPEAALKNLQKLATLGFTGKFGFYEAIDYTPSRLPAKQSYGLIQSFMSHHQGMTFISLANFLLDNSLQKLFQLDPSFQATMLLLQEKIPSTPTVHWQTSDISARRTSAAGEESPVRVFDNADTTNPEVQLLSNGRYHVMITNGGGGYSRLNELALTRWSEDSTLDNCGSFCYIKDAESGKFWSTAYQPTLKRADDYNVIFSEAKAEFRRSDHDIDTYSEISVSAEDDIELCQVRLTNRSRKRRIIELTSYAEVVLAQPETDAQQPAFSKLFVQTEIVPQSHAIVCHRRPRSEEEQSPLMFHLMAGHEGTVDVISYETDRLQFIGRGRTVVNPLSMEHGSSLSGTQGSVLDPIVSIRYRVTLESNESATVNIVTGIADTRQKALELIEKYRDRGMAERVPHLAWAHAQAVLRQLNATENDAQLYGRLANSIVYAQSFMRADASVLIKNRRGQSGLWPYAISGDLPIVLLQIERPENIALVGQMVQAHAYWRLKGLKVDLIILNEDTAGYRQELHDQIMALIARVSDANSVDKPGGIFIRPADQVSAEDRILFQSVARAIVKDSRGSLEQQLHRRPMQPIRLPPLKPVHSHQTETASEPPKRDLILFNGLGGFTPDGREYVITTRADKPTPAPWVNVLANPYFGSVISESGVSYSWVENAREFRLTPWNNDPVSDASGELFYIRDQDTGYFWSPSPLPARGVTPYVSRHGFGYSVFEHTEAGIVSELTVHAALDAPIKFSTLKLKNVSGRARKLSITGYVEWVLGDLKAKTAMQIVTRIDPKSGAIFAQNAYNSEFADRVAFFDVDDSTRTITCDRSEFFGRNGTAANPLAMSITRLSNKVGAALDPCTAIQVQVDLADGQEREIIFRMGSGRDANDATALVHRFRGTQSRYDSYEKVCEFWKHTLGTVNVQTPDDSLNMLVNGWLLYQDIACRVWGRSGYYQSGGAFGFRDQIQDTMALVHAQPRLLREQLILAASRQFIEGDVQHWWHPPSGRGVRTRCSDDFLWLPLATCRYVSSSGDTGVLDEQISFLEAPLLKPEEESNYSQPGKSNQLATLYEHCKYAIKHGLSFGEHGLPLMGSGDWNDGMNLVGIAGKGESVWLGFFLYDVLVKFQDIARLKGDQSFIDTCVQQAESLRQNIEKHAFDGQWYRRAYFDDGTPLGSSINQECKIDSIAQSWSVLSAAGDKTRSEQAMKSLYDHLVHRDSAIVQLLAPPFDKSALNPGYIKGYVPGVRENGGQYNHAAVWAAMAFAQIGDSKRAWELLHMINPVNHAATEAQAAIYKVEPYVVAGDIYASAPHTGRGGWTWYTGSAGWLYRLIVESLLGVKLEVNKLRFHPCLPDNWQEFKVHYRYYETVYHITVRTSNEEESIIVDGACMLDKAIIMQDDRREHFVEITVPAVNSGAMSEMMDNPLNTLRQEVYAKSDETNLR